MMTPREITGDASQDKLEKHSKDLSPSPPDSQTVIMCLKKTVGLLKTGGTS